MDPAEMIGASVERYTEGGKGRSGSRHGVAREFVGCLLFLPLLCPLLRYRRDPRGG